MEKGLKMKLWKIVRDNITPEQNTVITVRYQKGMTLETTGQFNGKSKDMGRQLEAKALRKLRLPRITSD